MVGLELWELLWTWNYGRIPFDYCDQKNLEIDLFNSELKQFNTSIERTRAVA